MSEELLKLIQEERSEREKLQERIEKLEETIFEIEAVRPLFTTMVNMNEEIAELKEKLSGGEKAGIPIPIAKKIAEEYIKQLDSGGENRFSETSERADVPMRDGSPADSTPPEPSAMNCKNWDPHATFCFQSKNCDICNEWEPRNEKPPKNKHYWNHLTDVSYCNFCGELAMHVGYDSECNEKYTQKDIDKILKQKYSEFLDDLKTITEGVNAAPIVYRKWQKELDKL